MSWTMAQHAQEVPIATTRPTARFNRRSVSSTSACRTYRPLATVLVYAVSLGRCTPVEQSSVEVARYSAAPVSAPFAAHCLLLSRADDKKRLRCRAEIAYQNCLSFQYMRRMTDLTTLSYLGNAPRNGSADKTERRPQFTLTSAQQGEASPRRFKVCASDSGMWSPS